MKRLVGAAVALLVLVSAAAAQAPGLALEAVDKPTGRIGLTLTGPPGTTVAVAETTRRYNKLAEVTLDGQGHASVPDAGTWRCRVRERRFRADAVAPDGTALRADARVRTPSCENRFELDARPRRPRAGRPLTVRLTDRFRLGDVDAKVCAAGRCVRLRLKPGQRANTARLRAPRSARATVTARAHGRVLDAQPIRARRPRTLNLLATGDSMIQIVDGFLKRRLASRNVRVRSDARISTGLSKPFLFNWPRHAVKQARRGADITVMFIGANDGFSYGDVDCCGRAWVRRYADVVSRMMSTYARDGAGRVYWCLLPAPREAKFRRVFAAVNAGIRRAARRRPRTARVVDLPKTFTPGFAYRERVGGRTVRQDDGVHLNAAGASIAANLILRRMRRDGVL